MPGLEESTGEWRYRLKSPDLFDKFRSVDFGKGIRMLWGHNKSGGEWEKQALRFSKELGWSREKANEWIDSHHYSLIQMGEDWTEVKELDRADTVTLDDVEIHRVGTWNGDLYTDRDLADIVSSFKEINHKLEAYFKLDHDPEQKVSGQPAIGWIKDLRKVGTKLMATITDVPIRIAELIKRKAYKRISSEIYWNYVDPTTKKKFRRALKASALLGATTPAVDTLEDVEALYQSEALVYEDERGEVHVCRTYEEEEMDFEKLYKDEKEAREKLVEEKKELEKTLGEKDEAIKKLEKEKEDEGKKLEKMEEEKEEKEKEEVKEHVKTYVKKMIEERRITPKLAKKITPLMEELALSESEHEYEKEDGKKTKEPMLKLFESVMEAIPSDGTPIGEDAGKSGPGSKTKDYGKTEDGQPQERGEIAARAEEIAAEKDVDLGTATEMAFDEAAEE